MRMALGIVAGIVVAFLCVFGVELVGHGLYPPPPGLDIHNPADQARLMAAMPAAAKAMVLAGWFVGALAGAWLANRIAGGSVAGWVVAALVVAAGVATMVMIPHPLWMWAGGIGLPLLAGWIAARVSGRRTDGAVERSGWPHRGGSGSNSSSMRLGRHDPGHPQSARSVDAERRRL